MVKKHRHPPPPPPRDPPPPPPAPPPPPPPRARARARASLFFSTSLSPRPPPARSSRPGSARTRPPPPGGARSPGPRPGWPPLWRRRRRGLREKGEESKEKRGEGQRNRKVFAVQPTAPSSSAGAPFLSSPLLSSLSLNSPPSSPHRRWQAAANRRTRARSLGGKPPEPRRGLGGRAGFRAGGSGRALPGGGGGLGGAACPPPPPSITSPPPSSCPIPARGGEVGKAASLGGVSGMEGRGERERGKEGAREIE